MRKLSTLIAIALIVTIGGVYAAWNYAQGTTASVEITREVQMAQVITSGNKGTIKATPTNVVFIVDDKGNYEAELEASGSFAITFTHATGADADTIKNGIAMEATITLKTTAGVTGSALLYYDPHTKTEVAPLTVNSNNKITLNSGAPTKSTILEASDIAACLTLASVKLDTKAENDAFHNALKNYTIVITISEVVAANPV